MVLLLTGAQNRSSLLFLRNSGRKTASHFSWNCSQLRLQLYLIAWPAPSETATGAPARPAVSAVAEQPPTARSGC
ncbi:hypothetical protein GFL96_16055 [Rhizobium leguminosarum bv. viciae]|nr:hypothetical protein [Rhizobium leguminosarum bv. viciae]